MLSTLQEQIEVAARTIATDSYAMSIGEIINMYRDEEIDIHPEFQRAYRWGIDQKSKLKCLFFSRKRRLFEVKNNIFSWR